MFRWTNSSTFATDASSRVVGAYRLIRTQPSWIGRFAGLTFLIVLGLPILITILAALLLAATVFAVLAACNLLLIRLRAIMPRDDGRRNVRVIRRADS